MLKRVLIANRGEIACRIMRTLKGLGIAAWPSTITRTAPPPTCRWPTRPCSSRRTCPTAAYLDQAQLIEAALRTGADGVHPGYGFLSENAAFAERVTQAGPDLHRPEAKTIRLMGDKIRSRAFAAEHGRAGGAERDRGRCRALCRARTARSASRC